MWSSRATSALLLLGLLLAPTACQDERPTLLLLCASSLEAVVGGLLSSFEREHGVEVRVSSGASNVLAQQLVAGAPGDVFLPADRTPLARVQAADRVAGEPVVVARNHIVLARWKGAGEAARVAIADEGVPAGDHARRCVRVVDGAPGGQLVPLGSEAQVVMALRRHAVDAAWIYASSLYRHRDELEPARALPPGCGGAVEYIAMALRDSEQPGLAAALVGHLAAAGDRWRAAGFAAPGDGR